MSGHRQFKTDHLFDNSTGALVGAVARDGVEYAIAGNRIDSSATPGNVTQHGATTGRVAVAAGQSQVVVTNRLVNAASAVMAVISQAAADATGTSVVRSSPAASSFTITLNTAATANTVVDWTLAGAMSP